MQPVPWITRDRNTIASYSARWIFWFFCILMLGGVFTDLASIWLHYHGFGFWRISLVLRGMVGGAIAIVAVLSLQQWPNYVKWLFGSALLSAPLMWVGYAMHPIASWQNYLASTIQLYKMIYPILLYVGLRIMFTDNPLYAGKLFALLDIIIASYLFFIFLGLITGSEMFRTYWYISRPGFKGIIMTQNEASGTILVSIYWFGLRYFSGQRHVLFFIASIAAALILGTKGVLIASIPLLIGMFWVRYGSVRIVPILGYVFGGIAVSSLVAFHYSDTIRIGVAAFTNYMLAHLSGHSLRDLFSLLLSGRDLRLEAFLPTLTHDLSPYFLVGGMPLAYGSMEMDPVDAFLRGGLIFLALLLVCYWKIFRFSGGKAGRSYKLVLFFVWTGVAFTGGHMWMASTTAPMLVLALVYASRMHACPKESVHRDSVYVNIVPST